MFPDWGDDKLTHPFVHAFWLPLSEQPTVLSIAPTAMTHSHKPMAITVRICGFFVKISQRVLVQLGPCERLRRKPEAPLISQPKRLRRVRTGRPHEQGAVVCSKATYRQSGQLLNGHCAVMLFIRALRDARSSRVIAFKMPARICVYHAMRVFAQESKGPVSHLFALRWPSVKTTPRPNTLGDLIGILPNLNKLFIRVRA
jgi:hypothetical protein